MESTGKKVKPMLRLFSAATIVVILLGSFYVREMHGEETRKPILLTEYSDIERNNTFEKALMIEYTFEQDEIVYSESQFRRFETIFFISLPAGVILTLAGIGAFRAGSGLTGGLRPIEYQYLILSACGISFTIAIRDNRIVYRKGKTP
ncbi:MAG: hypothetical protein ACUVWJ_11285 [Spirochaetota bacterium]